MEAREACLRSSIESEDEGHSDGPDESHYMPQNAPRIINTSTGASKLRSWLNKTLKIRMTDGRTLLGVFLCTDRDANIILGSCSEYLPTDPSESNEDPRMLGLVMIPGKHIVSVQIDMNEFTIDYQGSLIESLNYV
ncbi:hypothetical protein HUJ04_005417 [Dendroctonus ponderosae]